MTPEKLESMEKWQMVVALMGFNIEDIYNDYGDDDDYFYGLLEIEEKRTRQLANPSEAMKAVLQTIEMGITSDDIDEYESYLERKRVAKEAAEREQREFTNPLVSALRETYAFEYISSKQYPRHTHFRFKDKAGLEITGRVFRPSYGRVRLWLHWRDKKNKPHSFRWDTGVGTMQVPKDFPYEWREWGYTSDLKRTAQVIAYWVVEKKMPKVSGIVYPKK